MQKYKTWIRKEFICILTKWISILKFRIRFNYKILFLRYFSSTKIRPQAKIDNFAFKNSNIINEGLFWKRKDYFTWKKFETQKNNFINKFYFWPNFFSYRFLPNLKKLCDSNKLRIISSEKRFLTTSPFLIFKNKFFNGWKHYKNIFQNEIFINKLLNLIMIYSFSKIGNS